MSSSNSTIRKSSKEFKISQFFAIRAIGGADVSPDGKTIAYITNTNGMPNIWTVPIEGGWANQITLEDNAVFSLHYSPKKNNIIFSSDNQGDENHQLYLISDKGGEVTSLTPEHYGAQVSFSGYNKKGNKIIYCTNKRDSRFFDTYVKELDTLKETCISTYNDIYPQTVLDWSSNEKMILYQRYYSNNNHDLLILDTATGETKNITEHSGNMKNTAAAFNKKADKVYFLSDYGREFLAIAFYDIKSGKFGWEQTDKWDISGYDLSPDEKNLLYSINENGITRLKLKNVNTGKIKTLKLPKGNCSLFRFTKEGKKLLLILDTPQNPNDIYVYDIKKDKLKQVTYSMIGGIPKNDFIVPQAVKYNSFDGLEINAFLYIPKGLKKDGSNPAVVWPHGGPEWQEKNLFNKYFQIMANRGYIIIAPNFRGSTGYGKSFQEKIYKDWGGNEFKDVLGAYDYLVNSGYVDKNKIAVVGGSFGGFMTLTCVTKAPERWKCAVDIFGPSNLITFCNSVPEHWKPGVVVLVGDPDKDKDFLNERSPINFIDKITAPLLIIQGKNDPRVVQAESDQIAEKLKQQNKEVEYHVLNDEGHGFSKVSNQIMVWELICKFLEKHLKG